MKSIKYITSTGNELRLVPMSAYKIAAIQQSIKFPECPTYEVETVTGEKVSFKHTKDTMKDGVLVKGTVETEEEKIAFAAYETEYAKSASTVNERMTKAILRDCVIVNIPDDDTWKKKQERDGIVIPEDEDELKIHYITTELLGNVVDLLAIRNQVTSMSTIDAEFLQQAEELFCSQMGIQDRKRTKPGGNGAGEQSVEAERSQVPVESSEGVGTQETTNVP